MTSRTLRHTVRTSLLLAALGTLASFATPAAVRAQDLPPVYLGNNSTVHQDRVNLMLEEFRQHQKEARERAEHARKGRKHAGEKAREVTGNEDRLPANLRAGNFTLPFGITQATVAPTNTKANDKTADAAGAGQAEQSIAVLGQNGLCAWNDGQGFTTPPDVQGYGYTTNGGATWTDGGVPLKAGTITSWSSDPSVTVNEKTGSFYYCGLTGNSGTNNNGVGVARGHFVGATFVWDAATVVASGPSATLFFDKQWIACDSLTGNLYVTWTQFNVDNILFSRSTDNGATWSLPIQINGSWETGLISGSRPEVGPNGEVYVQYAAIGPVDADSMKIAKSTNFGASFSPSVVAMTEYDNYFTGAPGFNRPRAVTFPSSAVDRSTGPNRGRVYMTVQDCVNFYGDPLGGGTAKSEVENNGNVANATPFTINQTLRGAISATTDQDWWKFPAVQGTTYIFFIDSLRTTSFRYTMRLYCPNDTLALSRLAFSGNQSTTDGVNQHALIVWTAPTTNTYYLRMVDVSSTGGYRIRTGTHTAVGSDVARDTRDVMVSSSANGVTGWAPRKRVNDDLPLYDNWLPEVAVPCDGNAYVMWFDWRDTPASCFGGSNIYASRSTNGGSTWSPNVVTTTAVTANWTQVASNIAPNQGDYNGLYGGDNLGFAFADGRLGDADVFTARVLTGFSMGACPPSQTVVAGNTLSANVGVTNLNVMFANTYSWTLTSDHNWPGFPATGTVNAAEGGSGSVPVSITVPDSAAHNEVVHFCLTITCSGGCSQTCCFDITVNNIITPAIASLAHSTAEPGRVSLSWLVSSSTAVTAYRSEDGVTWTDLGSFVPTGEGYVNVEDTNVQSGARYTYRLGMTVGGKIVYAGQTWVDVPLVAEFAIGRVFPSPAKAGFSVTFSLPSNAPATLDVIDLAGRRVLSKEVGSMGAGRHTLSLVTESGRLPIGVYGVRLMQGGKIASSKVSVVR